jgi:hypothetical protein
VTPALLLDRIDDFSLRHRRAISAVSVTWFAFTSADYAGFISLPKLALLTGLPGMIASGLWSAIWWGAVCPWAETHREQRMKAKAGKVNG